MASLLLLLLLTKIHSFPKAGYREGITAGKENALQEGFDQGFAMSGVPIGRELGLIRGIVSAILSSIDGSSGPVVTVPPESTTTTTTTTTTTGDQIMTEIQEINARLSRIRFCDIIPPDLEAEEHARLHMEEDGDELDVVGRQEGRELERLENLIEQMNTDSEGVKEKGRPMGEDVEVLKIRLDQLAARLGMDINYT